jgi:hypothetical protein
MAVWLYGCTKWLYGCIFGILLAKIGWKLRKILVKQSVKIGIELQIYQPLWLLWQFLSIFTDFTDLYLFYTRKIGFCDFTKAKNISFYSCKFTNCMDLIIVK